VTDYPLDISVITACTGLKAPSTWPPLTMADFARGRDHVRALHRCRNGSLVPAEDLYRGQQHVRLMRGVEMARALNHRVSVSIVSAGYGLVSGDEPLASYECTFQGMPARERRAWARRLALAEQVESALIRESDAAVVLMGDDYIDACQVLGKIRVGAPTAILCGAKTALRIEPSPNVHVVALTENDTRRFACGLVGLKGEVASRLLAHLATHSDGVAHLGSPRLLDLLAVTAASSQMAESA
jgi:hypothetical protein